jgi:pimeloyl-ACP methyl ester carboxylesterase
LAIAQHPRHGQIYYELIAGPDPRAVPTQFGGDGPADRPVLVFLHEGLGCTAMWRAFPGRLCAATGLAGLVYDRIGHGQSSASDGERTIHYLHEAALIELPAVLGQAIPDRKHILVGHSDGGSIALLYAAERPPGLCGVITEAAHVFIEAETIAGIEAAVRSYEAGKLAGLSRYHGEKTDRLFWAWAHTWLAPWFQGWNIEHAVPAIQQPVLAVQGSADQYATAAQVEAIVAKNANRRGMMIEGSGHTPHGDQPDVVLRAMQDFVGDLVSSVA